MPNTNYSYGLVRLAANFFWKVIPRLWPHTNVQYSPLLSSSNSLWQFS